MCKTRRRVFRAVLILVLVVSSSRIRAQFPFPVPIPNNNNTPAGILIDAEGVVTTRRVKPQSPAALRKQVQQYAQEQLPADVVTSTEQRVLSLRKLEQAVLERLDRGEELPDSLRFLGGLQRIEQIVFDADGSDVLIVGPAEGFGPDQMGRMVGMTSGRPPMQLDDLVVALRSIVAGERDLGCSIDPIEANLARLQQFLASNSTPASTAVVQQRYRMMSHVLGNQQIRIFGVPNDSHFALALVEADYRMKRISLGVEPSGVKGVVSHLSLLAPQGNSLQRWWFVPNYDPLETNAAGTVFALRGPRAQLMSQEEISDAGGRRSSAGATRQSTQRFAQLFSRHFEALAAASPPFAELQSLYDFAVLAELIRTDGKQHLTGWDMTGLLTDPRLPVAKYPVPKFVPSESMFRRGGSGTMLGLVGGVSMDVGRLVQEGRVVSPQSQEAVLPTAIRAENWFGDASGE